MNTVVDQTQIEKEMNCFGVRLDALKNSIDDAVRYTDYHMIAMSMMSDAQEAMERNQNEHARQLLNRAKWVLSTYRERKYYAPTG